MIVTYTPIFIKAISDYRISDSMLLLVILYYQLLIILTIILTIFCIFHIFLIAENKTTLEYLENKVDATRGDYNLGLLKNF